MTSPPVLNSVDMDKLLLPLLERLEKKDFTLPLLPKVASQLLVLTNDAKVTVGQLTRLIQQDPILAARLLKTANSAACGAYRQIESMQQAVAWLGLNFVAGIGFALSFQSNVFNDRGYELEVRALWTHSLTTGFYAKVLAEKIGQNQEMAFLCGLLHSVGKFFVVHTVNEYHPTSVPGLPWANLLTLIDQSYVEIGRQLADEWNFPVPVKEAIKFHQRPFYHLATSPTNGAAITCLARYLATAHLDSEAISIEALQALPVVLALKIPYEVLKGILEIKDVIQSQIDALLV